MYMGAPVGVVEVDLRAKLPSESCTQVLSCQFQFTYVTENGYNNVLCNYLSPQNAARKTFIQITIDDFPSSVNSEISLSCIEKNTYFHY